MRLQVRIVFSETAQRSLACVQVNQSVVSGPVGAGCALGAEGVRGAALLVLPLVLPVSTSPAYTPRVRDGNLQLRKCRDPLVRCGAAPPD